jgi:hypothetical protein
MEWMLRTEADRYPETIDYGFSEFEYIEDPYYKQYINGGGPATNVAGAARIRDRRAQGRTRRYSRPSERTHIEAFKRAMRHVFVDVMRERLMQPMSFGQGFGVLPPKDTRTDWERALDENFYDPEERERRRREWEEENRCTCRCHDDY